MITAYAAAEAAAPGLEERYRKLVESYEAQWAA
jgi:hypothetical protein